MTLTQGKLTNKNCSKNTMSLMMIFYFIDLLLYWPRLRQDVQHEGQIWLSIFFDAKQSVNLNLHFFR